MPFVWNSNSTLWPGGRSVQPSAQLLKHVAIRTGSYCQISTFCKTDPVGEEMTGAADTKLSRI